MSTVSFNSHSGLGDTIMSLTLYRETQGQHLILGGLGCKVSPGPLYFSYADVSKSL